MERLTLTLNHIDFIKHVQQSSCSAFRHSWTPTQGIFDVLNLLLCITVYLKHALAAFVQGTLTHAQRLKFITANIETNPDQE